MDDELEPEVLEPVKVEDPPDFLDPKLPKGVFSHSQYTQYKICAKQYEFKYVEKQRGPPSPSMGRGSAIHKAVEKALKAKMAGEPIPEFKELTQTVEDEFKLQTAEIVNWDEEDPGEVRKEAVTAYREFHMKALPKLNPIAIEEEFRVKVGTVPMLGYIDMIDRVPAITVPNMTPEEQALSPLMNVIVDLKTTKTAWNPDKVRKNPQLTLYSVVKGEPNVRIDQLVLYKKGPEYKQVPSVRTPNDVAHYIEDLEETADLVKRGVFPKTTFDSWACSDKACPFWDKCRGRKR